ncbi:hypothetical protein OIV83_001155 [Microbotryomycetes sp. JL201]|nr:hypothetical protein OIV83_001155 [Microbotryomycetes sp. JL201]
MLSRSTRHAFHVDQENPTQVLTGRTTGVNAGKQALTTAGVAHTSFKTPGPSRSHVGTAKQLMNGGAATTGNRTARVLGRKDGNQGRGAGDDTQQQPPQHNGKGLLKLEAPDAGPAAGPSSQALLSPPQTRQLPAAQYRTPSPGVRRPAILNFSPELDIEPELEPEEDEIDFDQEVEYAGKSALAYDEPFVDESLPDFKTAGIGAALRSLPLTPCEDYDEWAKKNDLDIRAHKVTLDEDVLPLPVADHDNQPVFPLPRKPLQTKSSNVSATSSRFAPASVVGTVGNRLGASSKVNTTLTGGRAGVMKPTTLVRKPIVPAAPRPIASRPPLSQTTTRSTKVLNCNPQSKESSAGSSVKSIASSSAVARKAPTLSAVQRSASLVGSPEAEKELGIFGIEDQSLGLLDEDADVSDLKLDEFRFEV